MKITITYKTWEQTAPDDGRSFTEVVHLEENMTIKECIEKTNREWPIKHKGNVELNWIDD